MNVVRCAGGTTCNDLPAAVDLGGRRFELPSRSKESPGGSRGVEAP